MPPPKDLPSFGGPRLTMLEALMGWVHAKVVRTLPDEAWIRQKFLRRSIREVLDDGFTLAYAPCVDRTLVTSAVLGTLGIEPYIILHDGINGTWHLILEVQAEDGSWIWADYGNRESRLFEGRYRYAELRDGFTSRLVRLKGPRFSDSIWDGRPPLRFLAGAGVDLRAHFKRFDRELLSYRRELEGREYSLVDHLVRAPEDSVFAEAWRTRKLIRLGDPGVHFADLSSVHLYLDQGG